MSDATPADAPLLEVFQVAHKLNVSQEHVRRLLRTRKLSAIRLGTRWRVDRLDLQAFIDARRERAIEMDAETLEARLWASARRRPKTP